jgi:serralysin
MVDIPDNSPVDSLDSGRERTDVNISVHLVAAGFDSASNLDSTVSEGWSAAERLRVQAALDSIAAVANVTFTITNSAAADFQMVLSDDPFSSSGELGYFYLPDTTGTAPSVGVFNSDGFGWDEDGLREGGTGYVTLVHELLHGLGLAHPHDGANVLQGVTSPFDSLGNNNLNQGIFTTMSYNSGYDDVPRTSDSFGSEAGPMALDIAALQDLYGANMDYETGDNVYQLDDSNADGAAWKAIWDAGGEDTIQYSGTKNIVIDLRPATLEYDVGGGGWVSSADGVTGGYTIANGVIIENAIGGSGNDSLVGNTADNDLTGNGGNDVLWGGSGEDVILGGSGNDTATGGSGNDTIDSGANDDTVDGNSGNDEITTVSGTNTIYGGSGADMITGGSGSDTIHGGNGNDIINGNGGNDFLFGGRGNDTINGGAGIDRITGGMGADNLDGGSEADDFIFEFVSDSYAGVGNRDTITGFEVGIDDIDLSIIGGIDFDEDITLNEGGGNTVVEIDANGDGNVDMEIFIVGVTGLDSGDFIL